MNKNAIILGIVALALAYYAGSQHAAIPEKVDQSSELAELIRENVALKKKIEEQSAKIVALERTTVTKKIEFPDGTKITTTHQKTKRKVAEKKTKNTDSTVLSSTESQAFARGSSSIAHSSRGVLISVLAGAPWADPSTGLVYGASVSMALPELPLLGRIHVGGWFIPQLKWAGGFSLGKEF